MLNLLIADDNMIFVKGLSNYILEKDKNLRLLKIASTGKEILDIIQEINIDLILLDLNMPHFDGIYFLDSLESLNLKNIPKIIIISGEIEYLNKVRNNKFIYSCINKSSGYEKIFDAIQDVSLNFIINDSQNILKNINYSIQRELKNIGFNFKYVGTQYLYESIIFSYNSQNNVYLDNLEKHVYSRIAKQHRKTVHNIKSNILKAINCMYVETDFSILQKYFLLSDDIKPTPKLIISTIIYKLQ